MLDKLMRTSLQNRLVVIVASIILLVAGVLVTNRLPVDVFPDLTAPTVTVMTEAHGMAPEEVELLVTFPIETAVNGATGVRRVRSTSIQGFSTVFVEFEWGMDIYRARQIVTEKLQATQNSFPDGVDQPVLAPVASIMGEIMTVGLTADSTSQMDLRTLADFMIRRRLMAVPGVANVKVYGGEVKQYQVLVDPYLLRKYDLSLHEVHLAVAGANFNAAGGFYVQSGKEYLIRGIGRIRDLGELQHTVITTRNGVPVLLRDVGRITIGMATKLGEASVDNQSGVLIVISKQPEANTLELTKRLDNILNSIRKTLPEDIELHTDIFKQANFITLAIRNVTHALRDGAILVILVLLIFLGNVRTTLISSLAIPLSLMFSILILKLLNLSINTMTLGGMAIAIGVLVDDAIIYVENVYRRLLLNSKKAVSQQSAYNDVILKASTEIRAPIAMATFIVIIVFLPLFFLSGIEGRMLKPLGFAYVISIFASLLVAVTVTPALSSYFLRNVSANGKRENIIVAFLKKLYIPILQWCLRHKKLVVGAGFILLIFAIALLPTLGRSFLPEFNEGTLNISIATLPGTSLEESDKIGRMAETILLEHPAVVSVSRRTGRTEMDEHSLGSHAHEVEAIIDFDKISKQQLLEDIRKGLSLLPGSVFNIGQPISHRIDHMLSGTRASIAIKLFGPELGQLRSLAAQIENEIRTIPGIADLSSDQQTEIPQVRIRANRQKMALYGITVADVDEMIDTAFLGAKTSQVYEVQNQFDLVVRYDQKYRDNLDAVKNSLIDTPTGSRIPLEMVTDISIGSGPNYISRENVQRKMVVQANVAGRDIRGVVDQIRTGIEQHVSLPAGYYIEYGGQFESEQNATRIITLLSLLSIFFIFISLYLEFRNIRQALLVMVNLPLALIGGVIAIFITDGIISIASLVGFITLFGIAVRNGILMISHYNHLIEVEGKSLKDAVIQGSAERLNPIIMTALTTGLALTPLAFAADKPGNEIQSPLSVVILGGLITATFLNMIVLPVLFEKFGYVKKK
ncbi:efflux RND transporter permease subunit [candidate division KSB1 bacterium]|nr:efflux RND transporter permease subunit [candidate division KSB1 bacterium]